MSYQYIDYINQGVVHEIRLNRPAKKNALNNLMIEELNSAVMNANKDSQCRILIFSSNADVFSAGADLDYLRKMLQFTYEENLQDSRKLMHLLKEIYLSEKTTISLVNGHAIAGGCGLATVTDITLVNEQAKLGYTEVKIGFIAALVMVFLKEIVHEKNAMDLLLSGRLISAQEAKEIGLVSAVFSSEEFTRASRDYIQNLCENSPSSMKESKRLFRQLKNVRISDQLEIAAEENAKKRMTEDCKEGISSFLEKRKAKWANITFI